MEEVTLFDVENLCERGNWLLSYKGDNDIELIDEKNEVNEKFNSILSAYIFLLKVHGNEEEQSRADALTHENEEVRKFNIRMLDLMRDIRDQMSLGVQADYASVEELCNKMTELTRERGGIYREDAEEILPAWQQKEILDAMTDAQKNTIVKRDFTRTLINNSEPYFNHHEFLMVSVTSGNIHFHFKPAREPMIEMQLSKDMHLTLLGTLANAMQEPEPDDYDEHPF